MRNIPLAYIDPATGSIILQAIVAGAIGAVTIFRTTIWRFIRRLAGKKDGAGPPPSAEG